MADSTSDLTVEVLRQIRDQLTKTHERVETLSIQHSETNELIKVLVGSHSKLNERVDSTNARLDRLTDAIIKSRTDDAVRLLELDERLARVEKHLGLQGH